MLSSPSSEDEFRKDLTGSKSWKQLILSTLLLRNNMIQEFVIKNFKDNEVTLEFSGLLSPFACKLALARTGLSGFSDATGCHIQIDVTKVNVAEVAESFYEAYLQASLECEEIRALQKLIRNTYETTQRLLKWYSGASSKSWWEYHWDFCVSLYWSVRLFVAQE